MFLLKLLSRLLPESEPLEWVPAKELVAQAEERMMQPTLTKLSNDIEEWGVLR